MASGPFSGVLVPVVTPFTADLKPDSAKFVAICKSLLAQGADGLAIFGTTSEANSLSLRQREVLFDALIEAGIPAEKLMPGTGGCALDDVVHMTRKTVAAGCGGVLLLPPFYYKAASDDGVFAFVSQTIESVGDDALNLYLYHIPPQAVIGFSTDLLARLKSAFPTVVTGVKDSSGDWENTAATLREIPELDVFPGSEVFLLQGLRAGGKGCITATGNINVAGIRKIFENWQGADADELQARATEIRKTIQAYPLIPAIKTIIAKGMDDPDWRRVLPPLLALDDDRRAALTADLARIGFDARYFETA